MSRKRRTTAEPMPTATGVLHLLAVLVVVLLPHLPHLPPWLWLALAAAVVWRIAATLRGWQPLPTLWRGGLTLAACAGVFASYGRVNGLNAGVALLSVMAALKLTELRTRRDVRVLIALMYFILVTHFLYSQELWMAAYLLVCAWLITAVLIESSHGGDLPPRRSLRLSATLMLQALPLMAVIFVLFPRIPGPLWGLPSDSGAARAGLSDSMAPGDIQRLILSDAVAFRVRFNGPPPPPPQRYWRGPVFSFFDGRSWRPGLANRVEAAPALKLRGPAVRYQITLEPSRSRWLFALDLPDPSALPDHAQLDGDAVLLAGKDVRERRLYALRSHPDYTLQPRLDPRLRRENLKLPPYGNPKSRALAQQWRKQGLDDAAVIAAALRMFRQQDFHYTLEPPPLGHDSIDEFLFRTRAGFCEHYASSFTFLMRAAGIPARVVTGYQGGERNGVGDYYIVRDSDAHAWSEVWLSGRGWVREDPTAAVAPSRIDRGIDAALGDTSGLPAFLNPQWRKSWRYAIDARWDWVNTQWNRWFLAYGPDLQQRLMSALGLVDWSRMILALTAAITFILATLGVVILWQTRVIVTEDTSRRLWNRAVRKLGRLGLRQQPGEGAQDFAARVCAAQPALTPWMQTLCAAYLHARYLDPDDAGATAALARAARPPRNVDLDTALAARQGGFIAPGESALRDPAHAKWCRSGPHREAGSLTRARKIAPTMNDAISGKIDSR